MKSIETITNLEKQALDNWSAGKVTGYMQNFADDGTYCDDIGAQQGLSGREAIMAYAKNLEGNIPQHKYEMVNPVFHDLGETVVMMYRYHPSSFDGQPLIQWRATTVWNLQDGDFKMVHAHWTMEQKPGS